MPRLVGSIVRKVGTLALVSYVAWSGWGNLRPDTPQIGAARKDLADKVISAVVDDIRNSRGALRKAALLHLDNDSTGYFTDGLRRAIGQAGILDVRNRTISEKLRKLLKLRQPAQRSTKAVVKYGEHLGVGGVLYGVVHTFESYPTGAKIDIEVSLADVSTGQDVLSKRYQVETSPGESIVAAVQGRTRAFPWFQRLFGWLVTVLLLPVLTINFMRAMCRRKSNRANALVLALYTFVDALLAWSLVGAGLSSWWTVAVFVFAVAAAFAYNVRVMTFAVKLET
ncbi:MAG: hypothetical protein JW955_04365 [Sedimentisphaerales bacterium]|nr:hypothetical protein [Sedimentisphaerales bacterium]